MLKIRLKCKCCMQLRYKIKNLSIYKTEDFRLDIQLKKIFNLIDLFKRQYLINKKFWILNCKISSVHSMVFYKKLGLYFKIQLFENLLLTAVIGSPLKMNFFLEFRVDKFVTNLLGHRGHLVQTIFLALSSRRQNK